MLREYWKNTYVSNGNAIVNGNEVIFAAKHEEGFKSEWSLWKLDYQKERLEEMKSGLKYIADIRNNPYANMVLVREEERNKEYTIWAFNYDGEVVWKYTFSEIVIRMIVGEKGKILVTVSASRKGKLYCLSPRGELEWELCLDGLASMQQTAGNGKFYFLMSGKIYCIDEDGKNCRTLEGIEEKNIREIAVWKDRLLVTRVGSISCYTNAGERVWTTQIENAATQGASLFDGEGNLYFVTTKSELVSLDMDGEIRWKEKPRYFARGNMLDVVEDKVIIVSNEIGKHSVIEVFTTDGDRFQTFEREEEIAWLKMLKDQYVSFAYDVKSMKGVYINVFPHDKTALEDKKSLHVEDKKLRKDDPTQWNLDWSEEVFEYIKMTLDLFLEEYGKFEEIKLVFTMEDSPKISFKNENTWIDIDFLELKNRGENDDRDSYRECYFRDEVVWYEFVNTECPKTLDYIASKVCEKLEETYGVAVLREIN